MNIRVQHHKQKNSMIETNFVVIGCRKSFARNCINEEVRILELISENKTTQIHEDCLKRIKASVYMPIIKYRIF